MGSGYETQFIRIDSKYLYPLRYLDNPPKFLQMWKTVVTNTYFREVFDNLHSIGLKLVFPSLCSPPMVQILHSEDGTHM